jgi:tetratricopeptide (TPR) repeat protein
MRQFPRVFARTFIATLLLCWCAPPAGADEIDSLSASEREQRAKAHYTIGRTHLELREYPAAIEEFELGYRYQARPLFLYNIAQVARLAGQRQKALDHYQRYLAASPHASERAEVTQQIERLKESLAADPETSPVEPAAAPIAPAAVAPIAAPAPVLVVSHQPDHPKSRKKLWIALGVTGGVLVAGAVTLAVVLSLRDSGDGFHDWGALTVSSR